LTTKRRNRRYAGKAKRSDPRHTRHAHSQNARPATHARLWHLRPYRADEQRRFLPQRRLAIPGNSTIGEGRPNRGWMEGNREQQASEVLRPDGKGIPEAEQ